MIGFVHQGAEARQLGRGPPAEFCFGVAWITDHAVDVGGAIEGRVDIHSECPGMLFVGTFLHSIAFPNERDARGGKAQACEFPDRV